jgi:hypothetical protein
MDGLLSQRLSQLLALGTDISKNVPLPRHPFGGVLADHPRQEWEAQGIS